LAEIDETISRQWEMSYTDGKTEVLNFGVSGYCTRSEVELLETKGLRFEPDMVVVVFTENDFDNYIPDMMQVGGGFDRPAWAKSLFLHSQLFGLTCLKFNLFHFGAEADPQNWSRRAIGENNVTDALKRLQEISRQHQLPVVIAIWPRFEDDRIDDMHFMNEDKKQLVVEQLAAMHGIKTFRFSPYFREHWKSQNGSVNPRLTYTADDRIHPNVEGSRIAAAALKAIVEDEKARPRIAKNVESTTQADNSQNTEVLNLAQSLGNKPVNRAGAYTNKGKQFEQKGDLIEALKYYQLALEVDPAYIEAVFNSGVVYFTQGKSAKAASQFRQAIQLDGNFGPAHKALALLLVRGGNFEQAAVEFEHALRINPDDAEAHFNYGTAFLNHRRFDAAEVHLKRAVELNPELAIAHKNLGMALLNQKKNDRGLEHLHTAARLLPTDASLCFNIGVVYAQKGDMERAKTFFEKTLNIDPNFEAARVNLNKIESLRKKP